MDYSMFDNVYAGLLKSTPVFQSGEKQQRVEYRFSPLLQGLETRYQLHKAAGNGPDSQKIIRMVEWMNRHCFHNGEFDNHIELHGDKLLEFSFDCGRENGINCLCLSTALTECLMALGLRARTMSIMPLSPYDRDNHVVCEAYASDLGKWIMVDPTYGGYISDETGVPLNLLELRQQLGDLKNVHFSQNYNYNGEPVDLQELTCYYAKDLGYLMCRQIQGYHCQEMAENPKLIFAPIGLDVETLQRNSLAFRINIRRRKMGWDDTYCEQKLAQAKSTVLIYQHPDILYQEENR